MKFIDYGGETTALILAQPNRRIRPRITASLPFTDIETAIGAREQRRTFGRSSRYILEYTPWFKDAGFATEFRQGLTRLKDEPVAVPLWDDAIKLSSACIIGATTLQKTSDNPVRSGAEWIILAPEPATWNAWTYEIITVTAISSSTLTLSAPGTTLAWPAGTLIYPLLFGRLEERPTLDSRTPQKVEGALKIREDSTYARKLNVYPVAHQICGLAVPNFITTPVWDIEPNWVSVLDTTEVDIIYRQLGFLRQEQSYTYLQSNRRGLEFEIVCRSRAEIAKAENLFMNRLGPVKPFMVPTFRQDMVITADLPQAGSEDVIPVESNAYSDPDRPIHPGDPYIALIEPGVVSAKKIDHVLGNNLFMEVDVAETHLRRITRLSHLLFARFASPSITWEYATPQRARCRIKFVEVPDEYVTPADNVIEPAHLYEFTKELPTPQIQRFTSYENTIAFASDDPLIDVPGPASWTPAPYSHGSPESGMKLEREECEITSWGGNFPGNPLAGLFPYTLEGPLSLRIIEINAADPEDDYAKILFSGRVTKPNLTGKDWRAVVRWFRDSRIPRVYFQKTDNVAIYSPYSGVDKEDFAVACTFRGDPDDNTVIELNEGSDEDEDYFAPGYCATGVGANFERRPILHSEVNGSGRLEITVNKRFWNAVDAQAITLYPGTNGSLEQFIAMAGSAENFRGYPYMPIKDPSTNIGEVAHNAGGKKG